MTISVKRVDADAPLAVIFPGGELGHGTTNELSRVFTAVLDSDVKTVVISMDSVSALLSEGIRTLVALRDQAVDGGCDFHVTDLPVEVRYTLKITNLLAFLNHVNTFGEVLERCGFKPAELRPWQPPVRA